MNISLNLATDRVGQVMNPNPLRVESGSSVREVMGRMRERKAGSVFVCKNDVLIGIFTERDALRIMTQAGDPKTPIQGKNPLQPAPLQLDQPIDAVMTRSPQTLRVNNTVSVAVQSMAEGGFRRLPVVDERGRPLGIVKSSHLVHYLVEHFPRLVYNLPPEPGQVSTTPDGG